MKWFRRGRYPEGRTKEFLITNSFDNNHIRESIAKELQDSDTALRDRKLDEASFIQEGTDIKYFNRTLNTAVYESLINSGIFLKLNTDMQQNIADLYIRIMARNNLVYKIQHDKVLAPPVEGEGFVMVKNLDEKRDIMMYEKDILARINHLLYTMGYRKSLNEKV